MESLQQPLYQANGPAFRLVSAQNIMIKNGKINMKVLLGDILYIQAEHVYVRIYLRNAQSILYRISLTKIMEELDPDQFVRVHRSYVVNIKALRTINHKGAQIEDQLIPIGRVYRKPLVEHLRRLGLM